MTVIEDRFIVKQRCIGGIGVPKAYYVYDRSRRTQLGPMFRTELGAKIYRERVVRETDRYIAATMARAEDKL